MQPASSKMRGDRGRDITPGRAGGARNDDLVHCFDRVVLCLKLCWAIPSASGRETTLVNKL